MNDAALDELIAELGGRGVLERRVAWFEPSFHPECGIVLTRDQGGWKGWWVTTLRNTRGDPVLGWLDPTTSREPLPLGPEDVCALAQEVVAVVRETPDKPTGIILDGCTFRLEVRDKNERSSRSAHLSHAAETSARSLAMRICDLANMAARWDATRRAFASLRGYVG